MRQGGPLKPRLFHIANVIKKGARVIDVGSDHAYLPIYLIEEGIAKTVLASDISAQSVARSRENITAGGLLHKIEIACADGLSGLLSGDHDTIVIAGMGGDNIRAILAASPVVKNPKYTLILQPMTRHALTREYLIEHNFEIIDEAIVKDGGRLYTILKARYSATCTQNGDSIHFTPHIFAHEHAHEYIAMLLRRHTKMLEELKQAKNPEPEKIAECIAAIETIKRLRRMHDDCRS